MPALSLCLAAWRRTAARTALCLSIWAAAAPGAMARPADYRLGYGDAVSVTVVGQPNLSVADQPVRPDGRLSLPLVREVELGGKTVAEACAALTRAYRPYLTSPQIVMNVTRFRPIRVTLLGQLAKPGTLGFSEAPTLLEALATAGGLTERGARGGIKVVAPGQPARVYDLDRLLAGKEAAPALQEGTVVEVQEVWGPDYYRLIPIAAAVITAGTVLWRSW